jgi:hypothetical protein
MIWEARFKKKINEDLREKFSTFAFKAKKSNLQFYSTSAARAIITRGIK